MISAGLNTFTRVKPMHRTLYYKTLPRRYSNMLPCLFRITVSAKREFFKRNFGGVGFQIILHIIGVKVHVIPLGKTQPCI